MRVPWNIGGILGVKGLEQVVRKRAADKRRIDLDPETTLMQEVILFSRGVWLARAPRV